METGRFKNSLCACPGIFKPDYNGHIHVYPETYHPALMSNGNT